MHIIGINGRAGSGKSTFKDFLAQEYRNLVYKEAVEIIPFAQALKDLAMYIGWNGQKDEKGRRLLQLLGTEVCRECIDEYYWINKWSCRYAKALIMEKSLVIVDDVRFLNEAQFLKDLGATLIKITGRAYDIVDSKHPSEMELDNTLFHKIIYNTGTLQGLQQVAISLVKGLL